MKTSLLEILIILALMFLTCGYTYKGEYVPLKERRVTREHYRDYDYASRKYQKAYLEYVIAREREHPSLAELKERPIYYYNRGYKWTKEQYERELYKEYYKF